MGREDNILQIRVSVSLLRGHKEEQRQWSSKSSSSLVDSCTKMARRYQVSLESSQKNEPVDHSRHKSRLMQCRPKASTPLNPLRRVQLIYVIQSLTKVGSVDGNLSTSSQTWSDFRSSNDLECRLGYNLETAALVDTAQIRIKMQPTW